MSTERLSWKLVLILTLLALIGGTLSCGQEVQTGPRAWIDYPRDGSTVPVDTPVNIISHAYARDGVAEVLLSVDGEAYRRDPPAQPGATFSEVTQEWLPQEEGNDTLQVVTYDTAGETSNPAMISIRVVGEVALVPTEEPTAEPTEEPTAEPTEEPTAEPTEEPTAEPTEEPTAEPTEEPTAEPTEEPTVEPTEEPTAEPTEEPPPPPPADIRLWADDENIEAGSCTTVHWHVSNVQAYWVNGQPGAGDDGSFQTCPCQDETHTLRAVRSDGPEQNLSVTIRVSGQCEEPPPPPPSEDTTPPPVPSPIKPSGNLPSCFKDVILRWSAVSDESGIAGYLIKREQELKKGQWQTAGGWEVSGEELQVDVDCGVHYRWAVRAQDGAGNYSGWSSWLEFAIPME